MQRTVGVGADAGEVTLVFESCVKSHPRCKAAFAKYVNDIGNVMSTVEETGLVE